METLAYLTADWHVLEHRDRGVWSGFPEVRGDDLFILGQVATLCRRDGVPLLAAGDQIDGPDPDPDTLAALYDVLREVPAVYYVLGNHDRGRDWLLPLGSRAVRLDDRPVTVSGVRLAGLSYVPPDEFAARVRALSAHDVGLFHQTWRELCGGGTVALTDLPDNRLSVVGDVHVRRAGTVRGRTFLSPGPVSPQSVAEFMSASVWRLLRDPVSGVAVEEVPLQGRSYLSLDVPDAEAIRPALARLAGLVPSGTEGPPSLPFVDARLGFGIDVPAFAATAAATNPSAVVRIRTDRRIPRGEVAGTVRASLTTPDPTDRLVTALAGETTLTPGARNLAAAMVLAEDRTATLARARAVYLRPPDPPPAQPGGDRCN